MVARGPKPDKADTDADQAADPPCPAPISISDPAWVRAQIQASVTRETAALAAKPPQTTVAKAEREYRKGLVESYENVTGESLAADSAARRPVLQFLADHTVLQLNEDQLSQAEKAVAVIDELDNVKKKRWLDLFRRTKALQHRARQDICRMWAYVGRDKEDGSFLKLAQLHVDMLRAFDTPAPGVVVMAPPKHGKSTTIEAYPLWVWGKNPERRIAIVRLTDDLATDVVGVLRRYVESGEYRALYPHVRILTRIKTSSASDTRIAQQSAANNSHCFTLARPNWSSTEPSIEAVSVQGRMNGKGWDILLVDDPTPPEVVHQPTLRDSLNFKFFNETYERLRNAKTARVRLIATPWAEEDVAGTLIKQVKAGLRPGWVLLIDDFRIKTDASGDPISIWPERYDPAHYKLQRATHAPADYARLYELRCGEESIRPVKQVQFYPSESDDPAYARMQPEHREAVLDRIHRIQTLGTRILSIDPSATNNASSTQTAIVEFSKFPDGKAYVVDVHYLPGDGSGCMEWLIRRIAGGELYESRRVIMPYRDVPGDDQAAIDRKRETSRARAVAAGGVDVLLWEQSGGIFGQVRMTQEFLDKALAEMGVQWSGHPEYEVVSGRSLGGNMSKEARLRSAATYLENGIVMLPGRYEWNAEYKKWTYVCSRRPNVLKLVKQIIEWSHKRSDGPDCLSQFIRHYHRELTPDRMERIERPAARAPSGNNITPERIQAAFAQLIVEQVRQDGKDDVESWSLQLLGL